MIEVEYSEIKRQIINAINSGKDTINRIWNYVDTASESDFCYTMLRMQNEGSFRFSRELVFERSSKTFSDKPTGSTLVDDRCDLIKKMKDYDLETFTMSDWPNLWPHIHTADKEDCFFALMSLIQDGYIDQSYTESFKVS